MENETIKTITQDTCPHCGEPIVIEFITTAPKITSVYKVEDIEIAKKDAIARIEVLAIDQEKKENVIKWIQDPTTIFGSSEVSVIVENLLKPEK